MSSKVEPYFTRSCSLSFFAFQIKSHIHTWMHSAHIRSQQIFQIKISFILLDGNFNQTHFNSSLKHMRKHTRLTELQIELINYSIFKLLILNFNWKCCTFHSISSSALSSQHKKPTCWRKQPNGFFAVWLFAHFTRIRTKIRFEMKYRVMEICKLKKRREKNSSKASFSILASLDLVYVNF